MSYSELLLTIGVITFIVYTFFNILYFVEMRRSGVALRGLISRAEESLLPVFEAVRRIFENVETVTDNAAALSRSLREAADGLTAAQTALRDLYRTYEEKADQAARANIAGLRAGVKTGVATLLSNLKERKEDVS
jgi:hypothetical protein